MSGFRRKPDLCCSKSLRGFCKEKGRAFVWSAALFSAAPLNFNSGFRCFFSPVQADFYLPLLKKKILH